jgi:hypothetical protein
VTVGKLYTVGTAGELYIAGEVCGSELWAFGQAWRGLAGVGAAVPVAYRIHACCGVVATVYLDRRLATT